VGAEDVEPEQLDLVERLAVGRLLAGGFEVDIGQAGDGENL